jgi:regulator of protease activity HflC (stomatin/prohibitin superfamily)
MLERADVNTPLTPGPRGDGSLLTRDGDLAHLEFSARYEIEQPGAFVRHVNDSDARRNGDKLVELALRRAAIHVTAESSLQDLIDQTDDIRDRMQNHAQKVLDALDCGIVITQVQVQRAYAPLAIEKALGNLQEARVTATETIERARQKANETINKVAGQEAPELLALIEEHEDLRERGEEVEANELLAALNTRLEASPSGEVSQIIQNARQYQSRIESSLGNEYRRFASLLPAYRQNPTLLMRQHWLDVYAKVISRPDAETIYVDPLMSMRIMLAGSAEVADRRRRNLLARKEAAAKMTDWDRSYFDLRARDLDYSGPGRMLGVQDGKAVPYGTRP